MGKIKSRGKRLFWSFFFCGFSRKRSTSFGSVKGNIGIDFGSQITTQDKYGKRTEDTAEFSIGVDVYGFGSLGFDATKKAESTDSDKYIDALKNAWNAKLEVELDAELNLKGTSFTGKDTDLIVGIGGQVGVGGEVWFNITESLDLLKFIGSSILENVKELIK